MSASLSPDLIERFSRFVEKELGLTFPPPRWADLERGLGSAAAEFGFEGPAECARGLLAAPLARAQSETLAAHLTIGETYFFRDPRAFEALETEVLPALIAARRATTRRLRIWSAACCTGEEAYSLAIAVSRALPDRREWQVSILGTDLNPRFLQKAAAGVYSRWSFRALPEDFKTAWFRPVENGRFQVLPNLRALVRFECLNLVEDVHPSLSTDTNAMDVIFCRNVLMYFTRERAQSVAAKLRGSLVEDGWLFTGAAEASQDVFAGFAPAQLEGVAAYRKGGAGECTGGTTGGTIGGTGVPPVPLGILPSGTGGAMPRGSSTVVSKKTRFSDPSGGTPDGTGGTPVPPIFVPPILTPSPADEARRLADEGRLDEALLACDRAIALHKLDAESHYLRALIAQEQGTLEDAAASLRRALFLEPDFVVAHFALGTLLQRLGRAREAARAFENVRELLRGIAPEAELPAADGMTAGRLLAMLSVAQPSAA